MLAENCTKTASAIGFAIDTFVAGRTLESVEQIDAGTVQSDELHRNYREVITSRHSVEEAATAAYWERARPGEWELAKYRELSLLNRRIVYGLVAIDQLLRMPNASPRPPALERANTNVATECKIQEALEATSEMMQAVLQRIAHTSVRGTLHGRHSTAPEPYAMRASTCALQSALADYLRLPSAVPKEEAVPHFSRQVAVVQLVIDTALRVEALQEAAERGSAPADDSRSATLPEAQQTPRKDEATAGE